MLRYLAFILSAAVLLGCGGAPVQEMSDARQAIAAARTAGATTHSQELSAAQSALARAEAHLQAQEYARARVAALQAKRYATAALAAAQHPSLGATPATDTAPASSPPLP